MSENENKPQMTEWDRQVIAHLKKIIELDKAGKMKYYTREEIFGETRRMIAEAQAKQTKEHLATFQHHSTYAI